MKKTIFLRIFTGYIFIALTVSALMLIFSFRCIREHHIEIAKESLTVLSVAVNDLLEPHLENPEGLLPFVRDLGARTGIRITVVKNDGTVMADSEEDPAMMEIHLGRPEIAAAISGGTGHSIRYSTTLDQDMLYIAHPAKDNTVIRVSRPLSAIDDLIATLQRRILLITGFVALLALMIAMAYAHHLSRPIRELRGVAGKVASGDFNARVSLSSRDELGDLAQSFNNMTEKLSDYFNGLASSRDELESIIISIREGLLVLDKEGRIVLFNDSARRMTEDDSTDITNRYYWEIFRSKPLNDLIENASQPASGEFEINNRTFICSVAPLRNRQSAVIVLHDITAIKQVEQMKKDLVVNVSHELKTPLTAIKGFTETMIEDGEQNTDYLEIIKRHTDRLINIVNDLLRLSELEKSGAGANRERIDIRTLAENLLVIFETRLNDKGIRLIMDAPPSPVNCEVDGCMFEQLFTNLIDNAIKYTENGSITVSIKPADRDLLISVSDTGIGIPKEHLGRLFERFYVVDKSRSRSLGGTGLGLAIVKHIVNLHGGTIAVESTPGKGTVFSIRIPCQNS